MRRPANQVKTLDRIKSWRDMCPDLTIRSNFIVGFPGETEEDFEFLLDWIEEAEIDRAGCFKYEPVTGAPANELDGIVPDEVMRRALRAADGSGAGRLDRPAGQEGRPHHRRAGRRRAARPRAAPSPARKWDAPEIDGQVIIDNAAGIKPGDKVSVVVTGSDEYDLFAMPVNAARGSRSSRTNVSAASLSRGSAGCAACADRERIGSGRSSPTAQMGSMRTSFHSRWMQSRGPSRHAEGASRQGQRSARGVPGWRRSAGDLPGRRKLHHAELVSDQAGARQSRADLELRHRACAGAGRW